MPSHKNRSAGYDACENRSNARQTYVGDLFTLCCVCVSSRKASGEALCDTSVFKASAAKQGCKKRPRLGIGPPQRMGPLGPSQRMGHRSPQPRRSPVARSDWLPAAGEGGRLHNRRRRGSRMRGRCRAATRRRARLGSCSWIVEVPRTSSSARRCMPPQGGHPHKGRPGVDSCAAPGKEFDRDLFYV